jgi:uncharacterized protein (DUF1800 family)
MARLRLALLTPGWSVGGIPARVQAALRAIARLLIAAGALAPLGALEQGEARHLLARTGFGGTPAEISALLPLTREQAVDELIASTHPAARTPPPEFCVQDDLPAYLRKVKDEYDAADRLGDKVEREKKKRELGERRERWGRELKAWWMREMITTDSPLTERMTLLWHNHFTSSLRTVEEPRLMYEQDVLLRRDALDNFALMLRDINTDPAMFRYLDSDSNVAGRPNENYAREVMELFTLGEGQKYTEMDIKEAARAFTGYKIDPATGRAVMMEGPHDGGWKTILGRKGNFKGDDVIINLLFNEEQVAINISSKFWREFVSDTRDDKEVYKLAGIFYRAKYDLRKLLRATLLTKEFWDPANRGTLFKSPVEYVVGSVRLLQLPVDDAYGLVQLADRLGQNLMDPPNVKGWSGSTAWISSESLLSRWEIADTLLAGKIGQGQDLGGMMGGMAGAPPAASDAKPAGEPKDAGKDAGKEAAKDANKKDAKKEEAKPALALVAKPWIAEARAGGAPGIELAVSLLLPLPALDAVPKDFDQALRQILHDPTYNLK